LDSSKWPVWALTTTGQPAASARGWSVDDEEIVLGVRCVGAPVVDAAGKVRGAISVAGPAYRMTMERVQGLGPEVAEAARRVGEQLSVSAPAQASAEPHVVDGWSVARFSPDGNQDRVIGLPAPCPGDVALGGQSLDTLYVTSARQTVSLKRWAMRPCLAGFSVSTIWNETHRKPRTYNGAHAEKPEGIKKSRCRSDSGIFVFS